jgi:N-acetylglucosamine-6-phosphate deacetylase
VIQLFGHLYDPDDRGRCLVTVERNLVSRIEPAAAPVRGALGSATARIVPGLLDIQVNGAFGDDFADAGARMDLICRQMPRFGVTGFVPTIVTSAAGAYRPAISNLARSAGPGEARTLGIHIEGPYISPKHPGTHDPAQLRLPDVSEASSWLEAGPIAWFTLAPELPGAGDLVRFLVGRGVRVSMGHTDATWDDAARAADAGATMATHLFNAMRPFRHRDPGVAGYALASDLATGFIADGNHIAFETIRLVARVKGPDRLHLITDALAGLGMPPGRYWLAGREYVSDGTCGRLPDGTLSGSLLPMNLALGNLVDKAGLEPALAVRCATLNPARALGLEDRLGRVAIGREADLALLDGDWAVLATVVGGELAYQAGAADVPGAAGSAGDASTAASSTPTASHS